MNNKFEESISTYEAILYVNILYTISEPKFVQYIFYSLRPKCGSCHRATMVIAVRAHCNPLDNNTNWFFLFFFCNQTTIKSDIMSHCYTVCIEQQAYQ